MPLPLIEVVTAYAFAITTLETGRLAGEAIICPEARYASVAWRGAQLLERRLVAASRWMRIQRELRDGWPNGLVDQRSATADALISGRVAVMLQLVSQTPVDATTPSEVVSVLDARLRVPT